MTRTRNLSDLLDSNGDVKSDALDNVISEVSDDTTPALGGNLDVSGNSIVSSSNGDISITPNGTGSVVIDGLSHPQADGSNGQLLKTDGAGNLSFTDAPSSDLVDDTTPQLGGVLDTNGNNIEFPNSTGAEVNRLKFGAGDDLQIYHTGAHSFVVEEGSGDLYLGTNGSSVSITKGAGGETMGKFVPDGAVELYHDNSKKLETTSTGVNVTGNLRPGDTGTGSLQAVTGDYGSIQVDGGAKGSYEGYSIGGRVVLMHNNNQYAGIYNDAHNEWLWLSELNGPSYIYHNGEIKIQAHNTGMSVNGGITTYAEGSNNLRVDVRQGSCKMWLTFENQGTHSTYDSYNVSSTTDIATGNYQININNDFNNSNYSMTVGAAENGTGTDNYGRISSVATNRRAAGSSRHWSHLGFGAGTQYDLTYVCNQHFGDLA